MKNSKVSIVLVIEEHTEKETIENCLEYIKKQTDMTQCEILLLDTAAHKNLTAQNVHIIDAAGMSYSQAVNRAVKMSQGNYICILSPYTIVSPHWLEHLLSGMKKKPKAGMTAPLSAYAFHPLEFAAIDKSVLTMTEVEQIAENLAKRYPDKILHQIFLHGYCLLMRKAVFEKIEGLDTAFTAGTYAAWADFCFRARAAGWESMIQQDAFVHYLSYREQQSWYNDCIEQELFIFQQKWDISLMYSTSARIDLLQCMDMTKPELSVLEVGCACGATLLRIRDEAPQAALYGIELNQNAARAASAIADIKNVDIQSDELYVYQKNSFDYILFGDVLEHLSDPQGVVTRMKTLLKPGGKIIASIPNVMFIDNIRSLLAGHWTYGDAGILDRTHIRFFTLAEMAALFQTAGYSDIKGRPINVKKLDENEQRFLDGLQQLEGVVQNDVQFRALQYILVATA